MYLQRIESNDMDWVNWAQNRGKRWDTVNRISTTTGNFLTWHSIINLSEGTNSIPRRQFQTQKASLSDIIKKADILSIRKLRTPNTRSITFRTWGSNSDGAAQGITSLTSQLNISEDTNFHIRWNVTLHSVIWVLYTYHNLLLARFSLRVQLNPV